MGWNPLSGILQRSEKKGPPDLEDLFKNFFSKKKREARIIPLIIVKTQTINPQTKTATIQKHPLTNHFGYYL